MVSTDRQLVSHNKLPTLLDGDGGPTPSMSVSPKRRRLEPAPSVNLFHLTADQDSHGGPPAMPRARPDL
eukprot:3989770-Pyramimonas_sp.AAC.1